MREAWGWPLAIWDIVGALVAIYYWTLRRNYGSLMQGAALFEDLRKREQQALELNDSVLQGLVVAKMALDLDDTPRGAGRPGHLDRLGEPDHHQPARQRALQHRAPAQRPRRRRRSPPQQRRRETEEHRVNALAPEAARCGSVIIDDTADLRDLLRIALTCAAASRSSARPATAGAGIEVVRTHRPDVVLLDLAMPVMDGIEALP